MDSINPAANQIQRLLEQTAPAKRIAQALELLVEEGNTNPDEILSLIRLEPILAARLLREANATAPADIPGRFSSVEEAVTELGFVRMHAIMAKQVEETKHCSFTYSTDAWKRAITTAESMRSLAARHRIDPQCAYTIGLIHSIAEITLEARNRSDDATAEQVFAMNARLAGEGTAELSYQLFRDWKLPSKLTDPTRFQTKPLECQTTGKLACLLNLSKWVTGVIRETDELPDQALGPDILVLNLLGEGEQALWNLISEISDQLVVADAILQGNDTSYYIF